MISIDYRNWIRSLGCCVEACPQAFKRADCCHTGPHALGKKSSDLNCIPLCRRHHAQFDANPSKFLERFKIDLPRLIEGLNEIGLPLIKLHRPARKTETPQFVRTACICGWSSGWFRNLLDAQGSLHSHIQDQEQLALAEPGKSDSGESAA